MAQEKKVIRRLGARQIKEARKKLHARDPRCHWCGCHTTIGTFPDKDAATLDHIKPRWQCRHESEYHCEANYVIACFECNTLRDQIDRSKSGENRRQSEETKRAVSLKKGPYIEHILAPPMHHLWPCP